MGSLRLKPGPNRTVASILVTVASILVIDDDRAVLATIDVILKR